ncbi:CPBP family intramembrane metalloprotease (plasmid) [Clostridium estertheticum]|nr:CPBP family intramembrane glutamic endopeptidase [Clostridium estertheticum]WAG58392.1 CPBP family intramembrane metalloprotease [Clostridium estertheticum]
MSMIHLNKGLLFFMLFYGGGIAEETVYRLIFLSLIWKLTNKRWLSIVLSALLFGIYHLIPLNSMYKIYWGFPINQFVCATISGIVFGYIYTKRGYETAVIGHTFSDWLPILIFMR